MLKDYRNDIQGLRAIAVGLVLVFHAFPQNLPGGFVGVDVFFVISGFVITRSLVLDIERNGLSIGRLLAAFYSKRVRRILPALSVILLFTLAAGWVLQFPADYAAVGESALYSAFGAGNFHFFWNSGYFDPASVRQPLLHMWSLGVEEQFYLVWPLLLAVILWLSGARRAIVIAVIVAIVAAGFAYNVWLGAMDAKAAFYLPAARAWELAAGAALAFAPAIRRRLVSELFGVAGLLLVFWPAFGLVADETSTGLAMLPVIAGSAMLVWPRQQNRAAKLLELAPLRAIGAISFSLYLWHWPLLAFATIMETDGPYVRAAIIPLSILLAAITYRFVERPALDVRRIAIAIPASLAGTAVAAAFAGAVTFTGGVPVRYPGEIRPVLALSSYDPATKTRYPDCWLNDSQTYADYADDCAEGRILIWGDSHSGMLYPGIKTLFGDVGTYARNGCMPLVDEVYPVCAAGNREILARIAQVKPATVILFAAWLNYPVEWGEGWKYADAMRRTLRGLKAAGVDDIRVLGPAPYWDPPLPKAVYAFWSGEGRLPDRLVPSDRPHEAADATLRRIAEEEGASFISIFDTMCEQQECRTHTAASASELISWDYGHLTWQGADYLAGLLFGGPQTALR